MSARVLLTGASGKLGAYLLRQLRQQGFEVVAWSNTQTGTVFGIELKPVDLSEASQVEAAFEQAEAEYVIHCAALSAIGDCYRQPELATQINQQSTRQLGKLAKRIIYVSTDLVFDGERGSYEETDPAQPLSIYGRSKLAGELCLAEHPGATVARVSLLYGPSLFGKQGFFDHQQASLERGEEIRLFHDEWRSPLAMDEAADGIIELVHHEHRGLIHLGGSERMSRFQMGQALAKHLGAGEELLMSVSQKSIDFPEPRPIDVSFCCKRAKRLWGWSPSSFAEGLERLIGSRRHS